jgi:hypothetical protein
MQHYKQFILHKLSHLFRKCVNYSFPRSEKYNIYVLCPQSSETDLIPRLREMSGRSTSARWQDAAEIPVSLASGVFCC